MTRTEQTARPAITVNQTFRHARIHGLGGYRPERVVTNEEILQWIDSSDEWIRQRSGIVSRRFARDDETVIDMAQAAAEQAQRLHAEAAAPLIAELRALGAEDAEAAARMLSASLHSVGPLLGEGMELEAALDLLAEEAARV